MATEIPRGYWLLDETQDRVRIGMLSGALQEGELELSIPKKVIGRFFADYDYRQEVVARFAKMTRFGSPDYPLPIPASESVQSGILPDDWESSRKG